MRRRLRHLAWLGGNAAAAAVAVPLYAAAIAPYSRVRVARRRRAGRLPDVLWGPTPIINNAYTARAERLRGYRSHSLAYHVYHINQQADFDRVLDRWWANPVARALLPWTTFLWAGLRYDGFGFFYDGGLLGPRVVRLELPLLRLAGKLVVAYPYGGDARLVSTTRAIRPWNAFSDVPPGAEGTDDSATRARLEAYGRWAGRLLGCADLVEDLPRRDGLMVWPFDARGWEPTVEVDDGVVTVVHAPNHPHYKGTRFLEQAVAALRDEGLPVELVLVQGRPNHEARDIFRRADIIADQFLIGWYGLFGVEGMALGKPVLCYLNSRFRPFHPEWDDCPIVSADPDTLVDELRALVLDADRRSALGRAGPDFVRRYHDLEAIGARMDAVWRALWTGSDSG